jgi:hypothetical protein
MEFGRQEIEVFSQYPYWAYWYARQVLKGRWARAEKVIASSPKWALEYAKWVIGGRFELAETAIRRSQYAQEYADFIKFAQGFLGHRISWGRTDRH